LNSISVINLIVAVGLVAECVLHFVRTFLDVRGAKSSKEGGGSYEEGGNVRVCGRAINANGDPSVGSERLVHLFYVLLFAGVKGWEWAVQRADDAAVTAERAAAESACRLGVE